MELISYRFRAECLIDVARFLKQLTGIEQYKIEIEQPPSRYSDPVVTIQVPMTLEALQATMRKVVDSHVMIQTLALTKDYTGERNQDAPCRKEYMGS